MPGLEGAHPKTAKTRSSGTIAKSTEYGAIEWNLGLIAGELKRIADRLEEVGSRHGVESLRVEVLRDARSR